MVREDFISYYIANRYPDTIFETYYKEVSDQSKPWDMNAFNAFAQQRSFMNPQYLNGVITNIIVPYFKKKFSVMEVLDKNGASIKVI